MIKYCCITLLCMSLFACSSKEKDTKQVKKDSTTGVPEKLPEAQKDERFLNLLKDIPDTRFYVYASDLQTYFTTKIIPAIENGKMTAGLISSEQVEALELPDSNFGEKNVVWIRSKMVDENYIVLLVGASPKDFLQDDFSYYLVSFSLAGKYIAHIPFASFQEISPSTDTKSQSFWNKYQVKSQIEKTFYDHTEKTKRFTQETIDYEISPRGLFNIISKKLKRNYSDQNNLDMDDNSIDGLYAMFPFKVEGFNESSPDIKEKIDKENGFMSLENTKTAEKVVFTYFIDHASGKTFAQQYLTAEGDGGSIYETYFFVYGNSTWTDVTEDICPSITLKDFWGGEKNVPPRKYQQFFTISYELPQQGTTVKACLRELSTVDRGIDLEEFEKYTKKIRYQTIELNWNMDEGKFEIGKKY